MDEVISEVARRPVMQTTVHHHTKLVFNPGRVIQQVELVMLLLSSIHDCICGCTVFCWLQCIGHKVRSTPDLSVWVWSYLPSNSSPCSYREQVAHALMQSISGSNNCKQGQGHSKSVVTMSPSRTVSDVQRLTGRNHWSIFFKI